MAHRDCTRLDAVYHFADTTKLRIGEDLNFYSAAGALFDQLGDLVSVHSLRRIGHAHMGVAQFDLGLSGTAGE